MSVSRPWKDLERRHAKRLSGERIWRQDFAEVAPDGQTETDTWDCKCFQSFSVISLFVDCERKYREFTGKRRFHLCLFSRSRPRSGDFVLLRASDFADLLEKERQLAELR